MARGHCGIAWLLAVKLIAEGVETEQQLIALQAADIQSAQGFSFSPPLPAASFIAYHREASGTGRTKRGTHSCGGWVPTVGQVRHLERRSPGGFANDLTGKTPWIGQS